MSDKKKGSPPTRYPDELKERAVTMVLELRSQHPNDHGVITRVARQLGVGTESLRQWVRRVEIDDGTRAGATSEQEAEMKRLRKENFELRRANEILQAAASFFGAELDRRSKR